MGIHTSREFERELRTLRDRLLTMAGWAEQQIRRAVEALTTQDDALAELVIEEDKVIDQDEIEIDELAFIVMARRQPVASDLRFVILALKIVTDLERIGDLAVNIAKRVREVNRHPPEPAIVRDLERLGEKVMEELRRVLDALVNGDVAAAERVIAADSDIDALNTCIIQSILASAVKDGSRETGGWLALSSISRYLERIGDHATNIAEMVIYYVRGLDVRHHG